MMANRRSDMEIKLRCDKCKRELQPAWVYLPKEVRLVGLVSGDCHCGKINTAWQGVCELATIYGPEAVTDAAGKLIKEGV
jgi:hypothetical protein